MIEQEVRDSDSALIVPIIVATQALTGANADAVREILESAHETAQIDFDRAQHASELMAASGIHDPVDALVAVEALRRVPAIIITSDPDDLRKLVDADERGRRVAVWRV
jgi:hypothetical protein